MRTRRTRSVCSCLSAAALRARRPCRVNASNSIRNGLVDRLSRISPTRLPPSMGFTVAALCATEIGACGIGRRGSMRYLDAAHPFPRKICLGYGCDTQNEDRCRQTARQNVSIEQFPIAQALLRPREREGNNRKRYRTCYRLFRCAGEAAPKAPVRAVALATQERVHPAQRADFARARE